MDYLHPRPNDATIGNMSALALAHIGDGVYEIMTRSYLVCTGLQTARVLHSRTVALVRASAQYEAAKVLMPLLDEEETTVFHHGRNAKPKSVPKAATQAEYAYATAVEALFGYLFLKGKYDRLNELYAAVAASFSGM